MLIEKKKKRHLGCFDPRTWRCGCKHPLLQTSFICNLCGQKETGWWRWSLLPLIGCFLLCLWSFPPRILWILLFPGFCPLSQPLAPHSGQPHNPAPVAGCHPLLTCCLFPWDHWFTPYPCTQCSPETHGETRSCQALFQVLVSQRCWQGGPALVELISCWRRQTVYSSPKQGREFEQV